MNIKRMLLKFITSNKYHSFLKDTQNPEQSQNELWQNEIFPLLKRGLFWPQRMDLSQQDQLNCFEITSYEDYQPYLDKALATTTQPFNGEDILFWSETSATTGNRKYFPITKTFQKQFQRTMAPYFYSLLQRYPKFLKQKMLYLAAWETGIQSPAKIKMGLISYYNYKNLPKLIQSFYALPIEIFRDETTFNQWAPVYALAHDLSAVFAVVPIVMDTFLKTCLENIHAYLPYLLNEKSMPDDLPGLNISKERLLYLNTLNYNATLHYKDIWPGLTLAGCWTQGPCSVYAHHLAQELGDTVSLLDGTYSATEGWLTVPIDNEHQGGVLHPRTHIVEFIEENQPIKKENLLSCAQLALGKKYEVFLTTAMGFVRYRLKDVVECTGYFNKTPIIRFCYKVSRLLLASRLLLDFFALTESDLRRALAEVDIHIKPYWYFACDNQRDCLYLVVDRDASISQNDAHAIHSALIKTNEKYAYESKQGGILPCKIARFEKQVLLKNHHAQTKPKIISQDMLILEKGQL